jgi:hypothetical protein
MRFVLFFSGTIILLCLSLGSAVLRNIRQSTPADSLDPSVSTESISGPFTEKLPSAALGIYYAENPCAPVAMFVMMFVLIVTVRRVHLAMAFIGFLESVCSFVLRIPDSIALEHRYRYIKYIIYY